MASAIIKRRRALKRASEDAEPEFQVAPMVDVLLVLLLFFMAITSTELLKKERNLHLAEADSAKKDNKQNHQVIINVAWDGINSVASFIMEGATYPDAASFTGVLAQRLKSDPRLYVLIRADKDVQYSNIADLMGACAAAGISTVTFAVIQGNQKPHPDAATASN